MTLSPSVTDVELDQRVALNAILLGQDRATPEAKLRDASYGERRVADRLAAFDQVATDPEIMLNRYGVRYLGLPVGHAPPGYLTKQNWTRIQEGPFWQVWERRP